MPKNSEIKHEFGSDNLASILEFHALRTVVCLTLLVSCSPLAFSQENAWHYEVKEHDQIGKILERYKSEQNRLWGKNGLVQKTIRINPKILKKNGDFIRPNTLIKLPLDLPLQQEPVTIQKEVTPPLAENIGAETKPEIENDTPGFFKIQRPHLQISPLLELTAIKVTDTSTRATISAVSHPIYGGYFVFSQSLTARMGYEIDGSLRVVRFQNSANDALNRFDQPSNLQMHATGSIFASPFTSLINSEPAWRKLKFKLGGGAGEEFLVRRTSTVFLSIDKILVSRISFEINAPITRFFSDHALFSMSSKAALLMPTTYYTIPVKLGHEESLAARIETHLDASQRLTLGAQVLGRTQFQNTSQNEVSKITLGLETFLGFQF